MFANKNGIEEMAKIEAMILADTSSCRLRSIKKSNRIINDIAYKKLKNSNL